MRKTTVGLALICLSYALSLGQEARAPQATRVRSPFTGGNLRDVIQEVAIDIKEKAGNPKDRAAVRICSKDEMPVALITAAANPFTVAEYLEHYDFSRDRILFLRSENCPAAVRGLAVVEFWAVPEGTAPPPSDEAITAAQAKVDVVRTHDTIKNDKEYRNALSVLASKLSARPGAMAVVVGFYLDQPPPRLRRSVSEARTFLRRSNVRERRIRSRLQKLSLPTREGLADPKSKYPSLFIVETRS